jgi:hypothetical protein
LEVLPRAKYARIGLPQHSQSQARRPCVRYLVYQWELQLKVRVA